MTMEARRVKLHERLEALRLHRRGGGEVRACAWPGCEREGRYPAPRCRERLRDFIWLCLEHVREYNRNWDYFAGMSAEEIDAHRHADFTWHRPTWRFGTRAAGDPLRARFHDAFGLFGDAGAPGQRRRRTAGGRMEEMMARLRLEPGFSADELKRRYKELVKRYHPDLNGGDRAAEERLKSINEAYAFLRAWLAGGGRR